MWSVGIPRDLFSETIISPFGPPPLLISVIRDNNGKMTVYNKQGF